jgi:hypothetical protein
MHEEAGSIPWVGFRRYIQAMTNQAIFACIALAAMAPGIYAVLRGAPDAPIICAVNFAGVMLGAMGYMTIAGKM